jgi:hypothetical protein
MDTTHVLKDLASRAFGQKKYQGKLKLMLLSLQAATAAVEGQSMLTIVYVVSRLQMRSSCTARPCNS